MDMTMEAGLSSVSNLVQVTGPGLSNYNRIIESFLDKQPKSYQPFLAKEDVFRFIREGLWQAWLIGDEMNAKALVLTSIQDLGQEIKTLKVEFLSCQEFFWVVQRYEVLEHIARQFGCEIISSIAHPTIAEYLVHKQGYAAPGVFVTKTLTNTGRAYDA